MKPNNHKRSKHVVDAISFVLDALSELTRVERDHVLLTVSIAFEDDDEQPQPAKPQPTKRLRRETLATRPLLDRVRDAVKQHDGTGLLVVDIIDAVGSAAVQPSLAKLIDDGEVTFDGIRGLPGCRYRPTNGHASKRAMPARGAC